YLHCYSFFFQAEDGIRDRNVTGVQTCALPILYPAKTIHSTRAFFTFFKISSSYVFLSSYSSASKTIVSTPDEAALPITCDFGLSLTTRTTSNSRCGESIIALKLLPAPEAKIATFARFSIFI